MGGLFFWPAIGFGTSHPLLPLLSSGKVTGSEMSGPYKWPFSSLKLIQGLRSSRLGMQKHSLILAERKNKNKTKLRGTHLWLQHLIPHLTITGPMVKRNVWEMPLPPIPNCSTDSPAEPWPGHFTPPFVLTSCNGRMNTHITWGLKNLNQDALKDK